MGGELKAMTLSLLGLVLHPSGEEARVLDYLIGHPPNRPHPKASIKPNSSQKKRIFLMSQTETRWARCTNEKGSE